MLKNEMLLHQAYIPKTVFEESTTFVVQMQDDFDYWFDMAKCLFAGEYGKIDYEKGEKREIKEYRDRRWGRRWKFSVLFCRMASVFDRWGVLYIRE